MLQPQKQRFQASPSCFQRRIRLFAHQTWKKVYHPLSLATVSTVRIKLTTWSQFSVRFVRVWSDAMWGNLCSMIGVHTNSLVWYILSRYLQYLSPWNTKENSIGPVILCFLCGRVHPHVPGIRPWNQGKPGLVVQIHWWTRKSIVRRHCKHTQKHPSTLITPLFYFSFIPVYSQYFIAFSDWLYVFTLLISIIKQFYLSSKWHYVHEHSRLAPLPLLVSQTSLQQPHLVWCLLSSNSNNLFDSLNMFVRIDRPNPLVHSYGRYSLPKDNISASNHSDLVDYRSSKAPMMNYSSKMKYMQPSRTNQIEPDRAHI